MINFKQPEERTPSALILLSIAILAGTLLYMVFVPAPSAAGIAKGREISRRKIQSEISDAQTRTLQMRKETQGRIWPGDAELVTSQVLARLTDQANQRSLKLAAFRPQKMQPLQGVTELPYNVQLAGPYPVVRAMIQSLDAPQSRLVLRSIQIASSEAASSAVVATLGLSAYIRSEEAPPQNGKNGGRS